MNRFCVAAVKDIDQYPVSCHEKAVRSFRFGEINRHIKIV